MSSQCGILICRENQAHTPHCSRTRLSGVGQTTPSPLVTLFNRLDRNGDGFAQRRTHEPRSHSCRVGLISEHSGATAWHQTAGSAKWPQAPMWLRRSTMSSCTTRSERKACGCLSVIRRATASSRSSFSLARRDGVRRHGFPDCAALDQPGVRGALYPSARDSIKLQRGAGRDAAADEAAFSHMGEGNTTGRSQDVTFLLDSLDVLEEDVPCSKASLTVTTSASAAIRWARSPRDRRRCHPETQRPRRTAESR